MSYCPATTSITILSLYKFCLRSNKLLLNSLHSLEISSTYIWAKRCLEMHSTQIFHTWGTPRWELTVQYRLLLLTTVSQVAKATDLTWGCKVPYPWAQLPSSVLYTEECVRELAYLYNHSQPGAGRVQEKHPFPFPHSAGKETVLCASPVPHQCMSDSQALMNGVFPTVFRNWKLLPLIR